MKRPDLRRCVVVCLACWHWQADVRAGALSDVGGWLETMKALAWAHAEHIHAGECVGAGGRVKYQGQWVEPPPFEDGTRPTGVLGFVPLPAWWVAK